MTEHNLTKTLLVMVNYSYEPNIDHPEQLLQRYFMQMTWANACRRLGTNVLIFQRFHSNHRLNIDGIDIYFVKDSLPPSPRRFQLSWHFHRIIKKQLMTRMADGNKPTAICIHLHSLIFPLCNWHLYKTLTKGSEFTGEVIKLIVQHHAERPEGLWLRLLNRLANNKVNDFFFTNKALANDWIKANLIAEEKVREVMECTSNCIPLDKHQAKTDLRLNKATPLLIWTGNLTDNKDPLTILQTFRVFLNHYPQSQLLMLYRQSPLLMQVSEFISHDKGLAKSVHLVGEIDYQEIAKYYSAADIFVQGSHHEGSGIAVLDALACGSIPVITAIPSFKTITSHGSVGALWRCGDSEDLLRSLLKVMQTELQSQKQACITHFQNHWTADKIAGKAMEYYFERN